MSISAIGNESAASATNKLTLQDFLQVLLTQLTYQDPLKPLDNKDFMAQIAQFTSLEQTQQLNTNVQKLLNNQSALQSVGLIGRTVDISTDSGTLTGVVSTLNLSGISPQLSLNLGGGSVLNDVSISQILTVR
jgi:flagellar basal-body rod modification protein FlgD